MPDKNCTKMCEGCDAVAFSPDWTTGEGPYVCPKCTASPPKTFIDAVKGLLACIDSDIFYDADNYEDIGASENLRAIQMYADYLRDQIVDTSLEPERCKDSCHEGMTGCVLPCNACKKFCEPRMKKKEAQP